MTITYFKHGVKCGGDLFLDLSEYFTLRTPSLGIRMDGITVGETELGEKTSVRKLEPKFHCKKCDQILGNKEFGQVLIQCMSCSKKKPLTNMWVSREIPIICGECVEMIENPNRTRTTEVSKLTSYLNISSKLNKRPMEDILRVGLSL